MNRFVKSLVLGSAVAATSLAALPQAEAGDWRHRRDHARIHRHHDAGALVAAGVVGLAVGALIASANEPPLYRDPIYDPVVQPRPYRNYYRPRDYSDYYEVRDYGDGYSDGYRYAAEPWTAAWYDWCESRYRSFDAGTGTYRGYDGRDHFCVAN